MTTSSRDLILGKLRKSLKRGPLTGADAEHVAARVEAPTRNLIPARGQLAHAQRVALFEKMAAAVSASMVHVGSMDDVPGAVAAYLKAHNQPAKIVRAPDPSLDGLPWDGTTLEVRAGRAEGDDHTSVTPALAGVAETGTLVLRSGPETPYTLNMLPDNHIVVLPVSQIVGAYEEMWTMLRDAHGQGSMPRTVLWVTGPSRTGDIEQTIQLGAHGPRRLHIVLVDDIEGTA